jgi:transposase-like protein
LRSLEEKRSILAEVRSSGGSVAAIGRKYGVNANLIFAWMRLEGQGLLQARTRRSPQKLLAVSVLPEGAITAPRSTVALPNDHLEIVLPDGICVRVHGAVPSEQIDQVLRLLRR